MALVEPPGVMVLAVDVDFEQLAAAFADHFLRGFEQARAQSLPAPVRHDVELVQQPDRALVPHVGPERDQCDGHRGLTGQHGDHLATGQKPP